MSSLAPIALGGLLGGAQTRNQGGQSGLLGGPGAIDGSAQSFWNLADPFNITGHASSGHALSNILDPGNVVGQNQAANPLGPNGSNMQNSQNGIPSVLPNLGAASMIPKMPQGAFQPINAGSGPFNQMAAQSMGGMSFNPGATPPAQAIGAIGGKGGIPMSGMNDPIGNFGGQQLGQQLANRWGLGGIGGNMRNFGAIPFGENRTMQVY